MISIISRVRAQSDKLVVLMPTPSRYVEPYIESFKNWYFSQTGKTIIVEHVQLGGVKCVERVEEQKGTPREDVITSIGYDEFERLKKGGFLESYFSPNMEDIPEKIGNLTGRDVEGFYSGFSLAAYGIMLNTEVQQNKNLTKPTGYRDLANKKEYYGHIAMGSPITTSIAHGNFEVILGHYRWSEGWNICIHLTSLIDRFFISTDTATALTAEGEYAAVLTKNTYWNEYVKAGYPVEWIWPEEGTGVYVLYTGILKGSENQENAKLWTDWMLSKEGQRAWVEFRHETVLRSDIDLPSDIPTIKELNIDTRINPNYNLTVVQEQYDAVTDICWKLIGYHSMIQKNYLKEDTLFSYVDSWILKPKEQAEEKVSQAQDMIDIAEATTLTEAGETLLEQAKLTLLEAEAEFNISYDHKRQVRFRRPGE